MKKLSPVAKQILLALAGGIALGLSLSPGRYAKIKKALAKEFKKTKDRNVYNAIRKLYESKLISYAEKDDGLIELVLEQEGQKRALHYRLDEMKIKKPSRWDQKWRIILFDIPEEQKILRDTLRIKLKQLGLAEFQKSVFVHPYECRDEIDFVIELYDARRYVRFIEAVSIDNELHLKKKFDLMD